MKLYNYILLFSLLCLSFASCKTKSALSDSKQSNKAEVVEEKEMSAEDKMYANMGKDMCGCMSGMLKLSKEMEDKKPDNMLAFMETMQAEAAKVEACVKGLATKYPDIDFESNVNNRAEQALLDNCPEYKEMMEKQKAKQEAGN